jgi:hypothetical protein
MRKWTIWHRPPYVKQPVKQPVITKVAHMTTSCSMPSCNLRQLTTKLCPWDSGWKQ